MVDDSKQKENEERLHQIRQDFKRGENAGDPEIIDKYVADDAVVMPPERSKVMGKDAIKNMMENVFATYDIEIDYTSEEIVVDDELAFDRGTASEILTPKDGSDAIEHAVDYLYVYRRTADGEWKQIRAIWNYTE